MNKIISIISLFIISLIFTTSVEAAGLSVRIGQPKSPTNNRDFKITFVSLDINNSPVTARCFKKGPSESTYSQFGADLSLKAGGDTGVCTISSAVMPDNGVYEFYVEVTNGSESVSSSIVSVDYLSQNPGTPKSFSKEKLNSCDYKIKFKTDADGGKTKKVLIYRSDSKNFTLDGSSQVGTVNIGSDQEGEFVSTVSDCNKDYYFAIRAFDSYGNGSGAIGDSFTTVVTSDSTDSSTTTLASNPNSQSGAIPVSASQVSDTNEGEILGEASDSAQAIQESKGTVLGEDVTMQDSNQSFVNIIKKSWIWLVILVMILTGWFFYKQRSKN